MSHCYLLSVFKDVETHFHYNWGARGEYNGYCLAGVFNVDKGEDNIGWGNVVEPNTNTPFKTKSRGYDFKRNVRYFGIK